MEFTLRIERYNPDADTKPWFGEYTVDMQPTDRVLDALNEIKWHQDGTLSFRRSCAHGICGSDCMRINGRNRLACKELLRDYGTEITIEPMIGFTVIKDLIVDMEDFFDSYKAVMPYLMNDEPPGRGRERLQSPEEREVFDDTTKCIMCGACTSSCPITWTNEEYIGPAAIVNAHRFIYDSRDRGASERLEVLNSKAGVWRCRTIFNCTEVCPRGIQVTNAIQQVKRTLLTGD